MRKVLLASEFIFQDPFTHQNEKTYYSRKPQHSEAIKSLTYQYNCVKNCQKKIPTMTTRKIVCKVSSHKEKQETRNYLKLRIKVASVTHHIRMLWNVEQTFAPPCMLDFPSLHRDLGHIEFDLQKNFHKKLTTILYFCLNIFFSRCALQTPPK